MGLFPIPLRGAAVAAVTGSALSFIAVTVPPPPADGSAAQLRLTAEKPDDDRADDDDDDDRDGDDGGGDDGGDDDGGDDEVERRPSVQPVDLDDDDDDRFDVDELLESVKRAEAETNRAADRKRAEDDERAARERAEDDAEKARRGGCDGLKTGGLGAVKSHVREAAGFFGCRFGRPTMFGVAGRGGPSDHPGGLAIDFMVNRATGDALAQCALDNMKALGIKYVIWEQRINSGSGWRPMADRGGVTANHFDHVHVSFQRGASGADLNRC